MNKGMTPMSKTLKLILFINFLFKENWKPFQVDTYSTLYQRKNMNN